MRQFIFSICVLFLLGLTDLTQGQPSDLVQSKPNVILVITDDQGYGDLACHGNPWLKTPHLDALYKQSTRFTNFHVSPTCSPTRAALMTGHYTNRTGAWHTIGGRSLLKEDEITIADVFAANDYATAIFGKWHLGDNYPFRPQDRGFEEVLVHGGGGVGQQPDFWDNDYFDDTYFHNGKAKKYVGYCTDIWFEEALEYMDKKHEVGEPFFCYISTNAPHGPFYIENQYLEHYQSQKDIPNPAFYGMIENVDENIGKLLRYLKRSGLEENTILIFMTDNGTAGGFASKSNKGFNANMKGTKGSMYEGGHRVPLFVRWADGNIPAGKDINTLTAHIDILPTLIDLLDLQLTTQVKFDGISLQPLFQGEAQKKLKERILITDSQRLEMPVKWRQSATMQGNWRLVNGKELYDLSSDPRQINELSKTYPQKFKELHQAYEKWWNDLSPGFKQTPRIQICPDQEPTTLLFNHDMHFDSENKQNKIAWNQKLLREGVKSNGWFMINVPKSGNYQLTLLRYPESVQAELQGTVPVRPAILGTNVKELPKGKALKVQKAGIEFNGKKQEKKVNSDDSEVSFNQILKAGDYRFEAWFEDLQGDTFAAYYIKIQKIQ